MLGAVNGKQDLTNFWADISYSTPGILQTDPWHITLPTGFVPSPQLPVLNNNNDVMGLQGGGVLTGGPGNDTFAFAPNFGQVIITDYHPGQDILQIQSLLFGNAKAVIAHATDNSHGDAVITYNAANTITLVGISTAELHQHVATYYIHIV